LNINSILSQCFKTAAACLVAPAISMPHIISMNNSSVTVWYDGACSLCSREIALMRKLDTATAITFVDVASPDSNCPLNRAELLARFHAEENGTLYSGAAAFAAMWRAIPLLRPLGLAARNKAVLDVLERLYVVFLRHRPKLQQLITRMERKST
jgi:predicted DCC family thiol-disulfide oxidoreductase YuxK